ncbi:MAG: hypothetical protein ABH862_07050 [Candidatus Omnitrophota bacterium]
MKKVMIIVVTGLLVFVMLETFVVAQKEENISADVKQVYIGPKYPAKEKEIDEEDITVTTKKFKGQVALIRPGYLSIVDKKNKEKGSVHAVDFRIDESKIELSRVKSLDEIKVGDTIEIECEETRREYEKEKKDGSKEKAVNLMGRVVKKVTFVSSATSRFSSGG